jgi:hypothetical protein
VTKPALHAFDHSHGGLDPIQIEYESTGGGGGGGGSAVFAMTGGSFFFSLDDTPVVLDTPFSGGMNFYTNDSSVFDSSGGRARILVPGMYVIGCQIDTKPNESLTSEVDAYLLLQYGSGVGGGSIEIPWGISSIVGGSERLLGTRFDFPSGTSDSEDADVYLQRIHPLSLTEATSFPVQIRPTFEAESTTTYDWQVFWLGLWGWRLGGPLDAYHSD